jgi:hypothetical protein
MKSCGEDIQLEPNVASFYEHVVKTAREELEAQQSFSPARAFVLTRAKRLPDAVRHVVHDGDSPQLEKEMAESEITIVVAPLFYDGDGLYDVIRFLAPDEAADRAVRELVAMAPAFGMTPQEAREKVVRTFLAKWECDGKDIAASALRKLCHEMEAEAVIKVDEAYQLGHCDRGNVPTSLADDPNAGEVLQVYMETRRHQRYTILPFERTERDTGSIKSWGEQVERTTLRSDPDNALRGRFTGFIEEAQ